MEKSKVKFCGSCGAKMPETAQFCPKCGTKAPVTPGQSIAQNDPAATASLSTSPTMSSQVTPVVPLAGQAGTISSFGGAGYSAQTQTVPQIDLGMNWYKFIIYFALVANALLLVVLAINLFSGTFYGINADDVYRRFGGLRAFDIFFGLGCLAMAAMAIYVRQQLVHFKRDASRLLYMFIAAINVASLIYVWGLVLLSLTTSTLSSTSFIVTSMVDLAVSATINVIVVCAICLVVNVIYFNKRAHLFIN